MTSYEDEDDYDDEGYGAVENEADDAISELYRKHRDKPFRSWPKSEQKNYRDLGGYIGPHPWPRPR